MSSLPDDDESRRPLAPTIQQGLDSDQESQEHAHASAQPSEWHTLRRLPLLAAGAAIVFAIALAKVPEALIGGGDLTGSEAQIDSIIDEWTSLAPAEKVKLTRSDTQVSIGIVDGGCMLTRGPFDLSDADKSPAAALGALSSSKMNLLCFGNTLEERSNLVAEFSEGVKVALLPDIGTTATWPLRSGVESLPLDVPLSATFRIFGLRTSVGQKIDDIPLIVSHTPPLGWPIQVQLANRRKGQCKVRRDMHRRWFICRVEVEEINEVVSLVAFCPACEKSKLKLSVESSSKETLPEDLQLEAKPLIGWQAKVLEKGLVEYTVTVSHTLRSESERFQVVVLPATASLASEGIYMDHGFILSVGTGLATAVSVVRNFSLVVLVLSFVVVPGSAFALFPVAISCTSAFQIFALISMQPVDPQMHDLAGPMLRNLVSKDTIFSTSCLIFGAIVVGHLIEVFIYVSAHGKGSSTFMPHRLLVASPELRVLPFFVIPVACMASALAMNEMLGFDPLTSADVPQSTVSAALYASVPVVLLLIGFGVFRSVRGIFHDETVVAIPSKTGQIFFIDRVCSQIRAIPVLPSQTHLLGDWTKKLAWAWSPSIATIDEVTLCGSLDYGSAGTWSAVWANGPWWGTRATERRSLKHPKTGSLLCGCSNAKEEDAVMNFASRLSPVIAEQPVSVKPLFPYRGPSGACAGVVGLPWIDAAVTSSSLLDICTSVQQAGNEVEINAIVEQLSGNITHGRLAACFDRTDRIPLRWSMDLIVKVLLGIYVGFLPYTVASEGLTFVLLHLGMIFSTAALSVGALMAGPYSHMVDNIALSSSFGAIAITIACARYLVLLRSATAITAVVLLLLVLLLIPLVMLFVSSLVLAWFMISSMRRRNSDIVDSIYAWGSTKDGVSPTNVRVLPVQGSARVSEISKHELPAVIRGSVKHFEMVLPAPPSGPSVVQVDEGSSGDPLLPIPDVVLFGMLSPSNAQLKGAKPLGAILAPDKAMLLYGDKTGNGGVDWKDVVAQLLLGPRSEGAAQAAITAIQSASRTNALAILEIKGSSE